MTEAEYLDFEEQALEKHEFYDGIVRPLGMLIGMASGTYDHSLVIVNSLRAIGNRLDGTGCVVLDSNIRVKPRGQTRYSYPDNTIVCGEPVFDGRPGSRTTINNPTVVVEVLSPGTQEFDRTEKLGRYLLIDSLREIVLMETRRPFVQTILRGDDGQLVLSFFSGLDAAVTLKSVGVELPMAELYRDVTFPPPTVQHEAEDEPVKVVDPE